MGKMKALILNSGMGTRMGSLTSTIPKCMTPIHKDETILSRQLHAIAETAIREVVITTGLYDEMIREYCNSLSLPLRYIFVKNEKYASTNYIYSMKCAGEYIEDDLLLLHGDMVFDKLLLEELLLCPLSCMAVSSKQPLPEKDFKAVLQDGNIVKIGIHFFENAMTAQPLYKLKKNDWNIWLSEIERFCSEGKTQCYAEDAFNNVSDQCRIIPYDVENRLCNEVDNCEDLNNVKKKIEKKETAKATATATAKPTVYMCFASDVLHSGHMEIIRKAKELGRIIVGVLSDEAVASYKLFPMLPYEERKSLFENIMGISMVVRQETLSYRDNLLKYKPDYVVHGDDWKKGFQKPIREEVAQILCSYGGKLVEFPYSNAEKYLELEKRTFEKRGTPDMRRGRLRKELSAKKTITAMEVHSGLTGLIVENTRIYKDGGAHQFDAMWISSLCDSTAKGKPDIELVDLTSRFRTVDDICEVTTKPIIFDGDTGGLAEHFAYNVRSMERLGISMVIIEDKVGLKRNSLFGNEVGQTQAGIEEFCSKIKAGKRAQRTKEFMICARIESLILERGMEDALQRAFAYAAAGADAIMIHSRKKEPDEIFEFITEFRKTDQDTYLVVVPTTFNTVTEEEFGKRGVNIVIYANQLTRSAFPAMQQAAKMILETHRAKESDDICMPFREIISLIPEEL